MSLTFNYVEICERAFFSDPAKKLNIINTFDHIQSNNFPFLYPGFSVVVQVSGDPGSYILRIKIYKNNSELTLLESGDMSFEIKSGSNRHNMVLDCLLIKFTEQGDYMIEVSDGNRILQNTKLVTVKMMQ
jgi:hypothetical protein